MLSSSVTLECNILLMRPQNTNIAWNGMMLWADVTLLHIDGTLLRIHTSTQWCYVTCLYRPLEKHNMKNCMETSNNFRKKLPKNPEEMMEIF